MDNIHFFVPFISCSVLCLLLLTMKLVIIFTLFALAAAAPQDVSIVRYDNDNSGLDSYRYGFDLSDGTKRDEEGHLTNVGTEQEALSVSGSYSWVGPDNVLYTITYTADENGFKPVITQGDGGAIPAGVVASLLGK